MTPAELKTIRESLGLPLQWVADQAGVRLRTAQYWESGRNQVPQDVADLLRGLDEQLWLAVAQGVEQVARAAEQAGGLPDSISLVRYRTDADLWRYQVEFRPLPATTHGVLLARLMRELQPLQIPVRIIYMQPDQYEAWLGDRQDSAALRSQWAAEQKGL